MEQLKVLSKQSHTEKMEAFFTIQNGWKSFYGSDHNYYKVKTPKNCEKHSS